MGSVKDFIEGAEGDRLGDRLRLLGFEVGFVDAWWDDAAHGVWCDNRKVLGLKGIFHVAEIGRGDD